MVQNTCKNCGNQFVGKYCNSCGEKIYSEKDKSIKKLFEEFFHFIFHFEGSLLITIKTMFRVPGQVSLDYCNGRRKRYFKPLSLFLLLVVVYLIFPVFEGLNQKMYYYTSHIVYGSFAKEKIAAAMHHTGLSFAGLQEVFHQRSLKVSKFLLIILIPLTALWFWLLTFKKRKYFFDHMVFAAEVNAVFILLGFLLFPLLLTAFEWIYKVVAGNYLAISDDVIGMITGLFLYSFVAAGAYRFYQIKKWQAVLFGLLFGLAHFIIVQLIYKFILFNIVINLIN